jgi:predicted AAA+ superfamily ATPase
MITKQIHFKDYDLARQKIINLKTDYNVSNKLNISSEKGLLLTFEIKEEHLEHYLKLIEHFGLETY